MVVNKKMLTLVQRILTQAIEISSTSESKVFVDYSGHVNYISIKGYKQGWKENDPDYREDIWFDIYGEEQCTKQLETALEYLNKISEGK